MGRRGRPSANSLSVVSISEYQRPDPPEELTKEQAVIWRQVVNYLPSDWFLRGPTDNLANYCRHVTERRRIAAELNDLHDKFGDLEGEDRKQARRSMTFLREEARAESKAIYELARQMRLTQLSTHDRTRAKPVRAEKKPWEAA